MTKHIVIIGTNFLSEELEIVKHRIKLAIQEDYPPTEEDIFAFKHVLSDSEYYLELKNALSEYYFKPVDEPVRLYYFGRGDLWQYLSNLCGIASTQQQEATLEDVTPTYCDLPYDLLLGVYYTIAGITTQIHDH